MSNYIYQQVPPMNYDEWADISAQAERVPILPFGTAKQLEAVFQPQGPLTPADHQANLAWLKNLETELSFVWSYTQREASGMKHLVSDYEHKFALSPFSR